MEMNRKHARRLERTFPRSEARLSLVCTPERTKTPQLLCTSSQLGEFVPGFLQMDGVFDLFRVPTNIGRALSTGSFDVTRHIFRTHTHKSAICAHGAGCSVRFMVQGPRVLCLGCRFRGSGCVIQGYLAHMRYTEVPLSGSGCVTPALA